MDFFNNIGKRLTQAGQNAVQRTKELTDTARLNSLIVEEEKVISEIIAQIGKLYYEKHESDYESDFTDSFERIKQSNERINDYRLQLQKVKGTVICEKCGAENTEKAAFCNACGSPLTHSGSMEKHDEALKCQSCGATIEAGNLFCTKCGSPVQIELQDDTESDVASVDVLAVEESKMLSTHVSAVEHICPTCGAKLETDVLFCTECGAKLSE